MIVKKEFKGSTRGRDNKYNFSILKPGDCLIIEPESEINNFRRKVSTALYQWKKYNGFDWQTAVRVESGKINVYRIK